jgi:exopolyphosphatase/guanosine-5'-triphosphate,3'-diphosphate pyrophosphatase
MTQPPNDPSAKTLARDPPAMLAAVDLGSNSFRMVIARVVGSELRPVDQLREGVQLAAFLDADHDITDEGQRRALECLDRFGQRLRDFPPEAVRAVGTNTLRRARNSADLLEEAARVLGHPIEVISGLEEARLIFIGAAHGLAVQPGRRLVVDIGGGSTECVIGEGVEPQIAESMYMGCVGYSSFFPDGRVTEKRLRQAETAARLELRGVKARFRRHGWEQAVGSSGTILAISDLLRANGWSDAITPAGLAQLRRTILAAGDVALLELKGLRRDRAQVLPAGLAILLAIFEALAIERMTPSPWALREGVLYDLLGRLRDEDVRDRTIQHLVDQFHVDTEQSSRVERTALNCLEQVAKDWGLEGATWRDFLIWAAKLHEIGLSVAHSGFHKHGAYLVQFSDMPGFSLADQRLLALLLRGQRRKLPRDAFFDQLPKPEARSALRLCVVLRLALVLNRSRSKRALPPFALRGEGKRVRLAMPTGWLEEHPLTAADLEQEARYLDAAGFELRIKSDG